MIAPPPAPVVTRVPPTAPGAAGYLRARFDLRGGLTELIELACGPPLQVLRPLRPDRDARGAELQVVTLGPGLMGGDEQDIAVEAGPGTRVSITTQSATRVLPRRDGRGARVGVRLEVAPGAHLSWRPLPTILQAGAAYHQTVDLTLPDDATAFVWDVLVPGRLARGERFAFKELDAGLRVHAADGRLLAAERLRVRPAEDDPTGPAGLPEPDVVLGSLWVLGHGIQLAAPDCGPGVGATQLPNGAGLLVRTLAPTAQEATGRLALALALIMSPGESS